MSRIVLFLLIHCLAYSQWEPKPGDILFQRLSSSFGSAVEGTTGSLWRHVGILKKEEGKWLVVEAIPPRVRKTPLDLYLKRCKNRYAVSRLIQWEKNELQTMIERAESHLGKPYDGVFVLDDTLEIYCSELVYDAINHVRGKGSLKGKPMDFSGALEYWKKYFERKNRPIPQGKPGISPEAVYLYKQSQVVYHYKKEQGISKRVEVFELLYQ